MKSESGEVPVDGYYPDQPRDVYIYHPATGMAALQRFEGDIRDGFRIELKPAAKLRGRIVDKDGNPIEGVQFIGDEIIRDNVGDTSLRLVSDEQGQFEIPGLIPGRPYKIFAKGPTAMGAFLYDLIDNITVESAEIKELGDLTLKTRQ